MQDPHYNTLHKQFYVEELDSLDSFIRKEVFEHPDGPAAARLAQKVDLKVRDKLGLSFPTLEEAFKN